MLTPQFLRAARGRFPEPQDIHDDPPVVPEPETDPAAAGAQQDKEQNGELNDDTVLAGAPEPSSPEQNEDPALSAPRPSDRRAGQFVPQWLKRQGRAWTG